MEKICVQCDKRFNALLRRRRFCSHRCANRASGIQRGVRDRIEVCCPVCQKKFPYSQRRSKQKKFCSIKCRKVGLRQPKKHTEVVCAFCGKPKDVLRSRLKHKRRFYCNKKCQYAHFGKLAKRNGWWYEHGYKVLYVGKGNGRKEHTLIAEKLLGRRLRKNEVVHHKNKNKSDNRPKNLEVMHRSCHTSMHRWAKYGVEVICRGRIILGDLLESEALPIGISE